MRSLTKIRTAAVVAAVAIAATVACQAPAPPAAPEAPAPPDYTAELSPAFEAFIEVWNTKEYDKLEGVFAPNFRRVAPDQNASGPEEMVAFMQQVHAAYPDLRIVVRDSLYGDGISFARWTATGTATAEDGTETPMMVNGATMLSYADGQITEEWVYFDPAELTGQVGGADMPHAG